MNKLNKYQIYVVFALSVIGLVLVHGFIAITPYREPNAHNATDVYRTALNTGLLVPLILVYVIMVGCIAAIIIQKNNK